MPPVHLNTASAGVAPAAVRERVRAHLDAEAHGPTEAAVAVADELAAVPAAAAAVLGARPEEVAVLGSASEGAQLALAAVEWRPGDRVVTTTDEYLTQALTFRRLTERAGVRVEVVGTDADGRIDLAAMAAALRVGSGRVGSGGANGAGRVRLVSVCLVPQWTGVVHPVAAVAALAREAGAMVMVDAAQALGQVPVDAAALGADILFANGRKHLRAPRGTGLLVLRGAAAALEPPLVSAESHEWDGRSSPRRRPGAAAFERYERPVAAVLGLGVACGLLAAADPDTVAAAHARAGARLRAGVRAIDPGLVADPPAAAAGMVAVRPPGGDPAATVAALAERGVTAGAVRATDTPWCPRLPVLRLAPSAATTDAEIDHALDALAEVVWSDEGAGRI